MKRGRVVEDVPKVKRVKKSLGRAGPPSLAPNADRLALRRKNVELWSPLAREFMSLAPAGTASM